MSRCTVNSRDCCNFIHIKRNGGDGSSSTLKTDSFVILGRDESCDFRVQIPSVAGRHAQLRIDKSGRVYVSTLVANAPLFLNDEAVTKESLIRNKGILKVGSCSFRFEYCPEFSSPLPTMQGMNEDQPFVAQKFPLLASIRNENILKNVNEALSETPKAQKVSCGKENANVDVPTLSPVEQHSAAISNEKVPKAGQVPIQVPKAGLKEKVPTPIASRQRSISKQSLRRRSSLLSIPEQEEAAAVPEHIEKLVSTPVEHPSRRSLLVSTPVEHPSRRSLLVSTPVEHPSRRSLRNISLMSIPEVDEPTNSPQPCKRKLEPTNSPQPCKRKLESPFSENAVVKRSRKSVSFGPFLSPELFDRRLPPLTPVKAGGLPGGTRRQRSLPACVFQPTPADVTCDSPKSTAADEYSMTGFESDVSINSMTIGEPSSCSDSNINSISGSSPISMGSPTPEKESIETEPVAKSTKNVLPSPLKKETEEKPQLSKAVIQALPTLVQAQIQPNVGFQKTTMALPTPVRSALRKKPYLRKTKVLLPTPLREAIRGRHMLKKTRNQQSLPTPVRREIEVRPSLRKTKKSLPTPIRVAIESACSLKKTQKSMPTPLRREIESEPPLRKTKRSLPTPLRMEVQTRCCLRKTKQSMPTPLRLEIQACKSLRRTRKAMPQSLKMEIENFSRLRKTKRSMPTPLQQSIKQLPTLRKTKLSMPTPTRKEIESRPSLKKTKQSMITPLRKAIESHHPLKRTKPSLPTPIQREIVAKSFSLRKTKHSLPLELLGSIQAGITLHSTKRSLPSALRDAIHNMPILQPIKHALPVDIQHEIRQGVTLRHNKIRIPSPLKMEIQSKPPLRRTKVSLPSPLCKDIRAGIQLRKSKLSMPAELQNEIKNGIALKHVVGHAATQTAGSDSHHTTSVAQRHTTKKTRKRAFDAANNTPLPAPPSKKPRAAMVTSPTPYKFSKDKTEVVDLSVFQTMNSQSKVEFTANEPHANASAGDLACQQTSIDAVLFHVGSREPVVHNDGKDVRLGKRGRAGRSKTISTEKLASLIGSTHRLTRSHAKEHEAKKSVVGTGGCTKGKGNVLESLITSEVTTTNKKSKRAAKSELKEVILPDMGVSLDVIEVKAQCHTKTTSKQDTMSSNMGADGADHDKKPRRVTRSVRQVLITPVKPHRKTIELRSDQQIAPSGAIKLKNSGIPKQVDVAMQGSDVSEPPKPDCNTEQYCATKVKHRKTVWLSKQHKTASTIEQVTDAGSVSQFTAIQDPHDLRIIRRVTRSTKQSEPVTESGDFAKEAANTENFQQGNHSNQKKIAHSTNSCPSETEKSKRVTRSFKHIETESAVTTDAGSKRVTRSSRPIEAEDAATEAGSKRVTRSSRLK